MSGRTPIASWGWRGLLGQARPLSAGLNEGDEDTTIKELGRAMQLRGPNVSQLRLSQEARDLIATLREMRRAQRDISPGSVSTLVISMVQSPVEVFAALWLCSVAQLVDWSFGRVVASRVDIVPLFETIESLEGAGVVLEKMLADGATRSRLLLEAASRR